MFKKSKTSVEKEDNKKEYKKLNNDEMINNDIDYDECLFFYHYHEKLQKYDDGLLGIQFKNNDFPFLINNEFIIETECSSSIDNDKNLSQLNHKEALRTVHTRVKQFTISLDNLFKESFLENLTKYANSIGFENTIDLLIPVLSKIPDDAITIKIKFLKIFPTFFDFINSSNNSYKVIIDLMYLIQEFFNIKDRLESDLMNLACENFILISKNLKDSEIPSLILPLIINLANDEDQETEVRIESRVMACRLLSELSITLGKDLCEQFVIPQMAFLADDSHFKVRKTLVLTLISAAEVVTFKIFSTRIIPMYKTLAMDHLWNVRKSSVDMLPKLMKQNKEKSSYTANNQEFIKLFLNFIYDSQKFVRASAINVFGQFLNCLEKQELDEIFLNFYKNTVEEYYFNFKEFASEKENSFYSNLIFDCAYNFPAVLYCYGNNVWVNLKEIYAYFANDENQRVKQSIVSSFHEIAKIIGPKMFQEDLLPFYDGFLYHSNSEIRINAINNLPKIIILMSPEVKQKYLKFLTVYEWKEVSKFKWRKKKEVIEGYNSYFKLFDVGVIWNKILGLCIQLSFDDVFSIRKSSAKLISKILLFLTENSQISINSEIEIYTKIIEVIENFAYSRFYTCRINFLIMSKELIKSEKLYRKIIKDCFYDLIFDKVLDVRIFLAKTCSKILNKHKFVKNLDMDIEYVINDTHFIKICKMLSKDSKNIVRQYFKNSNSFQNLDIVDEYYEINPGLLFNNNLNYLINEFSLNLENFNSLDNIKIKSENNKSRNFDTDFSHKNDLLLNSESYDITKNKNIILKDETYKSESLDNNSTENKIYQILENQDDSSSSSNLLENDHLLDVSNHSENSTLIEDHSIN